MAELKGLKIQMLVLIIILYSFNKFFFIVAEQRQCLQKTNVIFVELFILIPIINVAELKTLSFSYYYK